MIEIYFFKTATTGLPFLIGRVEQHYTITPSEKVSKWTQRSERDAKES
jgi:hypothetical protein